MGASLSATGLSQAEPEVSALRASIPCAELDTLRAAIALADAAASECPVRRNRVGFDKPCPTCRATSDRPCGPVSRAEYVIVSVARDLASAIEAGTDATAKTGAAEGESAIPKGDAQ